MATEKYVVIPGTQKKVYNGSVVMLHRLPNLRWIIHYGVYSYNGRTQKGWYFSSIPADTTMPVFDEDLVAMTVLDDPVPPGPYPPPFPPGPYPPGPVPPGPYPPGPTPPAPIPIPFTPQDKMQVDAAMLTVDDLAARDKLGSEFLIDGKVVRVNDSDGEGNVEYYSWNASTSMWEVASLGYRYMTREEVLQAVADDIVDIVWSNENGALVVTNNAGTPVSPIKLFGVAHDPIYTESELTLRIPIYGRDDLVIEIPKDKYIRAIRFQSNWLFPDGKVGPAIVVTVSDGITDEEIAGDASGIRTMFTGGDTNSVQVNFSQEDGEITANVKLSSIANNPLKIDNEGMWVDLSGVVAKKEIQTGLLLVSDGNGEFTYGGTGAELDMTTAIEDLENPEKKVVTAKLIADAIAAAVSALKISLEARIGDIETRVTSLEGRMDFGEGENGVILITSGDGLARSSYKVGGATLDTESKDTVATEEALTNALTWKIFE